MLFDPECSVGVGFLQEKDPMVVVAIATGEEVAASVEELVLTMARVKIIPRKQVRQRRGRNWSLNCFEIN